MKQNTSYITGKRIAPWFTCMTAANGKPIYHDTTRIKSAKPMVGIMLVAENGQLTKSTYSLTEPTTHKVLHAKEINDPITLEVLELSTIKR